MHTLSFCLVKPLAPSCIETRDKLDPKVDTDILLFFFFQKMENKQEMMTMMLIWDVLKKLVIQKMEAFFCFFLFGTIAMTMFLLLLLGSSSFQY